MNIVNFGTGTIWPALFSLRVRDYIIIIIIIDFVAVFGQNLSTRAMVQSRFLGGNYSGTVILRALCVFPSFLILNCIIGGQTIFGILITSVISFVVTFFGYRFHWQYQSVAWILNVIAFIVMLAFGYSRLRTNHTLSWCTITPDYDIYHSPKFSSSGSFDYVGWASQLTLHTMGAAFAAATSSVPMWNAGFEDSTSVGGFVHSVLISDGGFGKLLTVLVALGIPSTCAPCMYTFSTSFMAIAGWFALVLRWIFYTTFGDILSVIGYWSAVFAAIVLIEHNSVRLLPTGIPSILAFYCACGALIPFMSQAWYVGPVAQSGFRDCGTYVGFVVAALTYTVQGRREVVREKERD
ncbi:cytosine-purine permease [Pisolithus marmoratus]|nr:cytosine-purine permease [Pisolithus marmoratus]